MNPRRNPFREMALKMALQRFAARRGSIDRIELPESERARMIQESFATALAAIYAAFSPQPKAPATDD